MKVICIRKSLSHRITVRVMAFICFFLLGVLLHFLKNALATVCIALPIVAILLPLVLYFETWTIELTADSICKKVFGRIYGPYSYHQIRQVSSARSATEQRYVRITFQDGCSFQFRMDDENARKALNIIQSHHSIVLK